MSAALLASSVAWCRLARRSLKPRGARSALTPLWIGLSAVVLVAAVLVEGVTQWQAGVDPANSSHDAMVFMAVILSAELVVAVVIMSGFAIARHFTGKLDRIRWASLENTQLLIYYTAAQALIGLVLVHGFPRML
jgi:cytochrome c oxidase subunit I+III